jgi:transposase InsO family protein
MLLHVSFLTPGRENNMHKNARLTPKGRAWMISRLEAGHHQSDVAQAMGVSLTTLKKWLRRFRNEGLAGLCDRTSRPRRSPAQLPLRLVDRVVALRRRRRTGRYIARTLRLSSASVSRILRRAHLSRWRELDPRPAPIRYVRAEPGELIHLDIKKLGRIRGIGHRIHGDRSNGLRNRGIGWDFVHVAIDDASRLAVGQIAPDELGDTATALLHDTVEHYRRQGIRVQRVMTDNGSPYMSKAFRNACQRLGIRHLRTKPYTPRTNGKAERFIQTALREWAYASAYRSSAQRTQALKSWLHHYNWHRPHSALDFKPPISKLSLKGNNLLMLHT